MTTYTLCQFDVYVCRQSWTMSTECVCSTEWPKKWNESGHSECWSQVHVSTSMMLLICTSVVQPTSSKVFDYYIASLVVKYWWHHSWQKFETSMWRCVNSVYKALVLLPIEGLGTRLELWTVFTKIPLNEYRRFVQQCHKSTFMLTNSNDDPYHMWICHGIITTIFTLILRMIRWEISILE